MKNLKLLRISPHVVWTAPEESTDRPILGGVVGRNATLMVEGGASVSHAAGFLAALSSPGIPLPKYMAITHWHWDHVFGAAYLDLPIFAHVDTARKIGKMAELDWRDEALDRRVAAGLEIEFCQVHIKAEIPNEERASLKLQVPDITFKDQVCIDLGGVTCQIMHVGGDHSPDSSIVYIPEDKVAFIGDCIYEDIYASPSRYTTGSLFPLLDQLLGLEADFYLDAHNPEPFSLAAMIKQAALLKTIGRRVDMTGSNRQIILSELRKELNENLVNEHLEEIDAFIAGVEFNNKFLTHQ